jgi:Tfp pilus assembly protein PilF
VAFSPDLSRLIVVPTGAPRIWNLAAIRQELARRGLDWPANVLSVKRDVQSAAISSAETLTLDAGNLAGQQAAAELVSKAGNAKDARAKESLEQAVKLDPDSGHAHNQLAWLLVSGPESLRDSQAAVRLARRAIEIHAGEATYWNTLGVALYRDAQFAEAVTVLEESLRRGGDAGAGFDLVFLALCHIHLGNTMVADNYFKEAKAWHERHQSRLSPLWQEELSIFFGEAKAVGLPMHASTN